MCYIELIIMQIDNAFTKEEVNYKSLNSFLKN